MIQNSHWFCHDMHQNTFIFLQHTINMKYIFTYIHTYIHTYLHTSLQTWIQHNLNTYVPTSCIHTCIPTYLHYYHLLSSDSLSLVLAPPPNVRPWDAKAKCSWIMVNVVCDLFYYPMAWLSPCMAVSSRRYQFEKCLWWSRKLLHQWHGSSHLNDLDQAYQTYALAST